MVVLVKKQEVALHVEDGSVKYYKHMNIFDKLVNNILEEKQDRCYHRAVQAYGKKTSAYRSAAMVKCRKGKIWKKRK